MLGSDVRLKTIQSLPGIHPIQPQVGIESTTCPPFTTAHWPLSRFAARSPATGPAETPLGGEGNVTVNAPTLAVPAALVAVDDVGPVRAGLPPVAAVPVLVAVDGLGPVRAGLPPVAAVTVLVAVDGLEPACAGLPAEVMAPLAVADGVPMTGATVAAAAFTPPPAVGPHAARAKPRHARAAFRSQTNRSKPPVTSCPSSRAACLHGIRQATEAPSRLADRTFRRSAVRPASSPYGPSDMAAQEAAACPSKPLPKRRALPAPYKPKEMRRVAAQSPKLRNVAVVGHGGSGKTTLAEGLLFLAGETARLGRVDESSSILDADPDAIRRRISVSASIAPVPWAGTKCNLIDTPGYLDFQGDVRAALRVADAALFVVDGVAGVEVGTELTWRLCDELGLPRLVFVNKMDRENASFDRTLEQLRNAFGAAVLPIQLPIRAEASLRGAVDVLGQQAVLFQAKGGTGQGPVPENLQSAAAAARAALVESAAEADDDLLARYLDGETLEAGAVRAAFKKQVHAGKAVPVLCGAAGALHGLRPLADAMVEFLPSPADRGPVRVEDPRTGQARQSAPEASAPPLALVWKTVADPYVGKLTIFRVYSGQLASDSQIYDATAEAAERIGQLYSLCGKDQKPVQRVEAGDIGAVAKLQATHTGDTLCDQAHPGRLAPPQFPRPVHVVAVEPRTKGDEDKISAALQRLQEEDPTLAVERNAETHQTLLSGLGELHLDVIMERLHRKFGVEVVSVPPRVAYRETIHGHGKAEGKHKKQTGGRGQFGHVFLELDPLPRGQGFAFVDKIFGGAVPRQYIPAVEKGLRECMVEGVLGGYPVVDVQATLTDGSYHPVDSSEMAFKIAASLAFKKAAQEAQPVLLEPIVDLEVTVPEEYLGDVMGDLNKKRGRIQGIEARGSFAVVHAQAPQAEVFRYAIDLRSMTQGRGVFTLAFSHYEEVPPQVAQFVIDHREVKAGV